MKVNLTHNGKPLIEPKCVAVLSTVNPTLHFQLETNEINLDIIKDIKNNYISLTNSGSFLLMETREKVYFFNTTSIFHKLASNFRFAITLMNEDQSRNKEYDDLYLRLRVEGFK